MQRRKGIVLIVNNKKGEYLLLRQKKSNSYSFISGGVEEGESTKETVVREAREEVGLKIDPKKLIETGKTIEFTGSKKGPAEQEVYFYDLETRVELKPDKNEISGFEWVTKNDAIKKLKSKPPLIKIIKYIKPVDSAFAIICRQDKILLLLRDNNPEIPMPNHWTLPGGGIDKGEKSDEAIRRELKEEVGNVPKNLNFLTKIKKPSGNSTYLYYAFVENDEAKKFKHGDEGQEIGFFTLDEIENMKLVPKLSERLLENKSSFEMVLKNKSFEDIKLRF